MTNEDYSKVPPPHLLKKFSEQAREDSQKRGRPGYCKTFAKLCIDWAFQEAAMDDLRVASAELSGAASQPGSSSEIERRSDIVAPPVLVEQWLGEFFGCTVSGELSDSERFLATRAAQWGADQELDACCEWISVWHGLEHPELLIELLRAARRPKPQSLNSIALEMLGTIEKMDVVIPEITDTIRRALEEIDD